MTQFGQFQRIRSGGLSRLGDRDSPLALAIADDAIDVVFQPQIDVRTSRVVGVEALARWTAGEPSNTLFDRARRSGMDAALSRHVQAKALAMAARWNDARAQLRLAINVGAVEAAAPDFAEWLGDTVGACGFSLERLTIEITEGDSADCAALAAKLDDLRAQGIRVALDDFGTGYANLAYLAQLPFDSIKVDRGLVAMCGTDKGRILLRSVLDLAKQLGLSAVAEGVETASQLDCVTAAGCDVIQGFLFAEPMDEAALSDFIRRGVLAS